mmetsp:Transcript_21689/g.88452  ORF Transcript_21689/g.88452 Transcript_21689/m.88452 type:complete len:101 (-) Transcript_21689:1652-1954(-)
MDQCVGTLRTLIFLEATEEDDIDEYVRGLTEEDVGIWTSSLLNYANINCTQKHPSVRSECQKHDIWVMLWVVEGENRIPRRPRPSRSGRSQRMYTTSVHF